MILGEMVPTASAKVERGFSLLSNMEGTDRTSLTVASLDSLMRIKEGVTLEDIANKRIDVEFPANGKEGAPSMLSIYEQLVVDPKMPLTVRKLAEAVAIEKDASWDGIFAELLRDDADEEAGVPMTDGDDCTIAELEQLLAFGATDDQ